MASTATIQEAWTLQSLNTAQVGRFHDGALILSSSGTPATSFRNGIIATASSAGEQNSNDFNVGQSGTPGMSVLIAPGYAALARSGDAPYVVCNTAYQTLTVTTSDPTNPRLDLVYIQVLDAVASDASTTTQVGIVTGTAAGVPTLPSLPSTGVCIPIAQVAVAANATSIVNANCTDLRQSTAIGSRIRLLMGGDSLSSAGNRVGEQRQRVLTNYGNVVSTEVWGYDSAWHGTQPLRVGFTRNFAANTNISWGSGAQPSYQICSASIPDPGFPYRLLVAGKTGGSAMAGQPVAYMRLDNGVTGTIVGTCYATTNSATGIWETQLPAIDLPGPYTGAHSVYYTVTFVATGGSGNLSADINDFYLSVQIVPV